MNAWYDIVGLDDKSSDSCDGIEYSVQRIRNIIDAEIAAGLSSHRIALAGFSQVA